MTGSVMTPAAKAASDGPDPMLRYVLRRLLTAIPTLFLIVTISFFLMRLAPGGPFNQERGLNQNRAADYAVVATATAGSTIPTFVIAPLYQLLFALTLKLVPVAGWGGGALVNKIGPILTLSLPQLAVVARLMRGSMIEALRS